MTINLASASASAGSSTTNKAMHGCAVSFRAQAPFQASGFKLCYAELKVQVSKILLNPLNP
jgi:hypothetical protein